MPRETSLSLSSALSSAISQSSSTLSSLRTALLFSFFFRLAAVSNTAKLFLDAFEPGSCTGARRGAAAALATWLQPDVAVSDSRRKMLRLSSTRHSCKRPRNGGPAMDLGEGGFHGFEVRL